MDLKDIQELIKFVAKSGATEVELEIDNVKISIKSPAKKEGGSQMKAQIMLSIISLSRQIKLNRLSANQHHSHK